MMGTTYKFSFVFMILVGSLLMEEALAVRHDVGGSQGWDTSTDFDSWTSGKTFKVGDQLVFKYSTGLHSVVEVGSESEYKKCDIGSAVNSLSGGNDVVKLVKPGTRYFACGTSGHCGQGMKLKVTTVAADSASTPTSSNPTSSTPTTSSTSYTPTCLPVSSMVMMLLLMVNFFFWY